VRARALALSFSFKLSDSNARWSLPGEPVRPSSASRSPSAAVPPFSSPASSVPSLALAVRVVRTSSSSFHRQQRSESRSRSRRRPPVVVRAPNRCVVDRTGNNTRVNRKVQRINLNQGKKARKLGQNIAPRRRRLRLPVGHRSRVVVVVVVVRSNVEAAYWI